jgi:hypothetical protein
MLLNSNIADKMVAFMGAMVASLLLIAATAGPVLAA